MNRKGDCTCEYKGQGCSIHQTEDVDPYGPFTSNLKAVKILSKVSAVLNNQDVFKKGYDCGKNGPNEENCHFSLFSTSERTKAWEEGKKAGEKARK